MQIINKLCWLGSIILVVTSCSSGPEVPAQPQADSLPEPVEEKEETKKNDTVFVREASAVFYSPDSLRIEEEKKLSDEEEFYTGADDYLFYMSQSAEYLEKQKLPVVHVEGKKVLHFISSGQVTTVRTDTIPELWGVYLFRPGARPHFANILDMEEEYKKYYGRK